MSQLSTIEHPGELELQQRRLDELEETGVLLPGTAARYRADLVERGVSIFGRPMDGPTARKYVEQWNGMEVDRAALAALNAQRTGDLAAASNVGHVRHFSPARPRERRARRSQRSTARGDPDPEHEPPLKVVPVARFRRDVRRRPESRVSPAARAEVQRILNAEARRMLGARLEGDAIVAPTRGNGSAGKNGLDDAATGLEAQAVPVRSRVENDSGSVDAL
jgi:hypothetical protein